MKRILFFIVIVILLSSSAVSAQTQYLQDSTWESHWNTLGSNWERDHRILRTFNGCGNLLSQQTLRWDLALSEWIYQEEKVNTYHSDNTTLATTMHRKLDPAIQSWIEIFHAYYNDEGKITERQEMTYDMSTSSYLSGDKTTYTYTPNTRIDLRKNLVVASMTWENSLRTTITYNDQEQPILLIIEVWSGTGWVNAQKSENTYNAQGDLVEGITCIWNSGTSVWDNYSRVTNGYNASGWNISINMYVWDATLQVWENMLKIIYQYDERGNVTLAQSYEWDNSLLSWKNDSKYISTYYASDTLHEMWRSVWLETPAVFMDIQYYLNDSSGHETESWTKSINYQTGEYYQGYRTLYSYSDDLLVEILGQTLVVPGNIWGPAYRKSYAYDAHQNLISFIRETWDDPLQVWINAEKDQHFWSEFIGIEEVPGITSCCTFSNPLQAGDRISCPNLDPDGTYRIRLIGLNGQVLVEQPMSFGETLKVPGNLPGGMYLLVITDGTSMVASGKVVVI